MEDIKYMVRVSCMTFNHAHYIEDAMNGFCMQETNFPFVCTIMDDASTDGEQDVIKNYLEDHFDLENSSIVRNEETDDYYLTFAQHKTNKNCYFAVLFLKYNHYSIRKPKKPYIEEWCDTKYVALCEGDDYWINPNKLQTQVDFLEDNSSYVLCFTNYSTLFEDGTIQESKISDLPEGDDYSLELITKGNKLATLTVLYRTEGRNSIPKMFSQNKWKMGDLPLWIELSQLGLFKYLPEITAVYRKIANSASHSTDINKRVDFIRSTFEIKKFYADYYQKNLKSNYLDTKMYEALLNEAFLSKDIELSRALFKEAKSKNINSFDLWKTYVLTAYPKNLLVLLYLNLRKRIK